MVCVEVQVTLVSLASLNCSALLLERLSTGVEEDDSGDSLNVASELLDIASIGAEEEDSRASELLEVSSSGQP